MSMDITWSDSIYAALASCLPCLSTHDTPLSPGPDRIPRARPDELEALLQDVDALSLHSNVGHPNSRKRKKVRGSKRISIFGYDLFGRPPIQLPPDDDVHDEQEEGHRRSRTTSSSTLDSDVAPLDASAIQNLSSESSPPARVLSQEEHDKEARRQRRRERKERKRASAALVLQITEEFEGFPGSGSSPPIRSPFQGSQHIQPSTPSSDTLNIDTTDEFEGFPGSGSQIPRPHHTHSSPSDDFGEYAPDFRGIRPVRDRALVHGGSGNAEGKADDDDYDDADLGGELYSRRRVRGSNGSDSRSRTSGSQSQQSQGHYAQQQLQPHRVPLPPSRTSTTVSNSSSGGGRRVSPLGPGLPSPSPLGTQCPELDSPRKTKYKSKSSLSKTRSAKALSSPSTSQSPSLPSPVQSPSSSQLTFSHTPHITTTAQEPEFEGFQMDGGAGGFPITGFGIGNGGKRGKGGDMGAFLASRG